MRKSNSTSKIEEDLAFCNKYWTIIYGSFVSREFIPERSDIDVAIITRTKDQKKNFEIWMHLLENVPGNYDLRIFELLPLYIQIEIIDTHRVLFGDPLEVSEYFYHYRKFWKDMDARYKANQFHSISNKLDLIERRKIYLKHI